MKQFNQLKLNDTLFEVSGYFNEAKQVLVVKCREFLSVVKAWRYEEVLIQKLELMKDQISIYHSEEKLLISDIEHEHVKLVIL